MVGLKCHVLKFDMSLFKINVEGLVSFPLIILAFINVHLFHCLKKKFPYCSFQLLLLFTCSIILEKIS
jgi:hypothetical protein